MAAKALLLVLLARICFGETGFEITLPAGVASETFSGRYLLTGSFGGLGGWLEPKKDVESYRVETVVEGQPATRIKAVLYAPGCALQTFDGEAQFNRQVGRHRLVLGVGVRTTRDARSGRLRREERRAGR